MWRLITTSVFSKTACLGNGNSLRLDLMHRIHVMKLEEYVSVWYSTIGILMVSKAI